MRDQLKKGFSIFLGWKYMLLTILVAAVVFLSIAYIPNIRLLNTVVLTEGITISQKLAVTASLFKGVYMNDSNLSILYTIIFSVFTGLNVSLIVFVFRKRIKGWGKGASLGLTGILGSMLGIGCAACGSLIIAGVAYVGSLTPFILSLPLQGAELELVGFILIITSTALLLKQAAKPLVC